MVCPLCLFMSNENNIDVNQLILEQRQLLEYKAKDSELVKAINQAIQQSNILKLPKDKEGKKNEEYWKKGTDPEITAKIHPKKAKTTNNRIWANLLTIIPYWVNRTPEPTPIAKGLPNNVREKLIKSAQIAWEVSDDMKWKIQKAVLHWIIYKIGWLKMRWNEKKQGIETINTLPTKIGFDSRATKLENCEYIWEMMEDTAENIVKRFPKGKKQVYSLIGGKEARKSKLRYIEFWGGNGKWVAWKLQNILLDKMKNPNFDYENPQNNIFKEPKFPYLLLNCFNLGYSLYDDVSIVEQARPLQDSVNKLERQILDLNEGQKRVWVGSGEAISKESFQKVVDETGDIGVYMDRKIPQGGLQLPLSGKPDASLFNNLEHLLGEIDNVMGVHAALRGQYTPGMSKIGMRGYAMMINQDLAKDLIVSRIEQLAENWFNMYFQFCKVYQPSGVEFNDSQTSVELTSEEIPQGLRIMVKKGSMLPVDRASRADMAFKLAGLGLEAPLDVYKDLGYGDAETRVKDLEMAKQGNITGEQQGSPELSQLQQFLQSPQFKQLPIEKQQEIIQRSRNVVEAMKGQQNQGGTM